MGHDVFISHSSKDKAVSDAVCALLERRGFRCWIAPRDIVPGQEWGEAIVDGIRGARIFVLIFSSNANFSQQVRREVERAAGHGLPIIPFRIEDVPPARSLEYFISSQHWLDALKPPMEQHLSYLGDVVGRLLAEPEAASPAPPARPVAPSSPSGQARQAWQFWAGTLVLAALLAGIIGYVLSRNGGTTDGDNNVFAGNSVEPSPGNQVAPAPPLLGPQPRIAWLDFAAVRTSREPGSFMAADPQLREAAVPAVVEGLSPAGAQLLFVHRQSLEEGVGIGAPGGNLLVLETPARSPAAFTLRFAEPVAELRFVRPGFGFFIGDAPLGLRASTADRLTFPAFSVTAYNSANQRVDGARRASLDNLPASDNIPADTITLRGAGGIVAVRFEAEDAILFAPSSRTAQRTFHAFMFESVWVRRMPQPAAPAAPPR